MARDDEAGYGENAKSRHAAHVSRVSHPKGGGHSKSASAKSPLAKANRAQWDAWADAPTGGDGPYVPQEYPKHVIVGGVLHVCSDAAHEARVTAAQTEED